MIITLTCLVWGCLSEDTRVPVQEKAKKKKKKTQCHLWAAKSLDVFLVSWLSCRDRPCSDGF